MAKPGARKAIVRPVVEIRAYEGKNDNSRKYLVMKGHVKNRDVFQAFAAVELKEAVLDIEGIVDTPANRKLVNSAKLAKKIWSTTL